jgi:hypothetical protein
LKHPLDYDFNGCLREIQDNRETEYLFGFGDKGYSNTVHKNPMTQVCAIKPDIARFRAYYRPNSSQLKGLQMWDREANLVYESADKSVFTNSKWKSVETVLE